MKLIDRKAVRHLALMLGGLVAIWGSCRFYPFNGLAFALDKICPNMSVDEVKSCVPSRFYVSTEHAKSPVLCDRIFNTNGCVHTTLCFEENYIFGEMGWGEVYFDSNGIVVGLSYSSPELFGLGRSPYNAQTAVSQNRYRLERCGKEQRIISGDGPQRVSRGRNEGGPYRKMNLQNER